METLLRIIFKQVLCVYTGGFLRYLIFRITGSDRKFRFYISINDTNGDNEYYKSFYTGVIFWIVLVVSLSIIFTQNDFK